MKGYELMKYRQKEHIVTRKVAGEVLLVPVKGRLADMQHLFSLNETAEVIWQSLKSAQTEEALVQKVTDTFNVEAETARADVRELLDVLLKRALIEQG